MQSKAETVSAYLNELPNERKEILTKLRKLCLQKLKGYEEVMKYGMPGYKKDGALEVSFASQANYIALYILKQDVIKKNQDALKGLKVGKGCIRFPNPNKIDLDLISKLLADTAKSPGKAC
jgi:uncharacterized protein YdhG (YjbR/CyaY superfamily)